MSRYFVVSIKYNIAVNRAVVIREDANSNREILTKNGHWKEWSPSVELLDDTCQIREIFRYHPSGKPPD